MLFVANLEFAGVAGGGEPQGVEVLPGDIVVPDQIALAGFAAFEPPEHGLQPSGRS